MIFVSFVMTNIVEDENKVSLWFLKINHYESSKFKHKLTA